MGPWPVFMDESGSMVGTFGVCPEMDQDGGNFFSRLSPHLRLVLQCVRKVDLSCPEHTQMLGGWPVIRSAEPPPERDI